MKVLNFTFMLGSTYIIGCKPMYNIRKALVVITLAVLTIPAMAAEITTMILDNGAKVRLNDDFTWEYVILETNTLVAQAAITTSTSPTTIAATPTLNAHAMSQAALLKSTAKGDVKVSFINSQWDEDGRLGLSFDLVSSSSEHYVLIELDINLFDDTGKQLKTETIKVWKAIFRMPDTYLRKGQQRESRIFWIEGIEPTLWTKN